MDDGQCATCGAPASAASAAGVAAVAAAGAMGGQGQQQQQRCGACGAAYGGEAAPPPELGRAIIADLMRSLKAYDVMAESNKVIVFDVTVPVRLAFYALVEHGEGHAERGAGRGLAPSPPTAPSPHPPPPHPPRRVLCALVGLHPLLFCGCTHDE